MEQQAGVFTRLPRLLRRADEHLAISLHGVRVRRGVVYGAVYSDALSRRSALSLPRAVRRTHHPKRPGRSAQGDLPTHARLVRYFSIPYF